MHILHGDMDSHESLTAAAQKTAQLTGGVVDYLIVNGAYFAPDTMPMSADQFVGKEDLFLQELKQIMQTNVAGTLFAFNAFLPLILKSDIKRVTAISSAGCERDFIFEGEDVRGIPYATSKAALNTLVAKYSAKYKHDGVLFLSISPGFVSTHDDIPKEVMDSINIALKRFDPAMTGPITPQQSAEMCLKVINGLKKEQNGEFLSQHGNKVWLNER